MKQKIAVIVTNIGHYEAHDEPTGLWLGELTHFWEVLTTVGYQIDLISPNGGKSPLEPKSLKFPMIDKNTRKYLADSVFMALLDSTIAAVDAKALDYGAIYYTGGHGVMFDFIDDPELQRLTREIWEQEGIVSSVCHGFCGLLNVKLANGQYLISDKTITGFSWTEEVLAGVAKKIPFNAQALAEERSSSYTKALLPFTSFVETDGRLVTGQNPGSAKATAHAVLNALVKLESQTK